MVYIDKSALVAEIDKLVDKGKYNEMYDCAYRDGINAVLHILKNRLNTLEVKEVDLDALGVLAEHLIACDAHLVTPKYTDKELNLLEEWAVNNKAQKGE